MGLVIFAIVCASASGLAVWLARHARSRTRTRRGPVPGYSYTPGVEVALGPTVAKGALEILSVEEFHSPGRSRLILTLESDAEHIDATLPEIARDFQARSHANVILVERLRSDGSRWRYMYAPDGHGWSGSESLTEAQG